MKRLLAVSVLLSAGAGATGLAEPQAAHTVKDGVYTTAQADAGKTAYTEKCASCHGTMTSATPDMAPLLND